MSTSKDRELYHKNRVVFISLKIYAVRNSSCIVPLYNGWITKKVKDFKLLITMWLIYGNKGPFIIYGGGWHRREMFFVAKIFLTQPLKKSKIWLPNLKYQLKNKYPPLAKNFTKGWHSVVTYVLYHFCDMSLITDCEMFCSLKLHIYFLWRYHLSRNKSENDQDIVTLIDSHIVLTNDWGLLWGGNSP
jgi:hypothetical protein